ISDRPDEVDLVVSRAIGFSGPPSFTVEVSAPTTATLKAWLTDSAALLAGKTGSAPSVIGFVMQAMGAQGMLLAGVFSPDLEKVYGNSILYKTTPSMTPKLEDLK